MKARFTKVLQSVARLSMDRRTHPVSGRDTRWPDQPSARQGVKVTASSGGTSSRDDHDNRRMFLQAVMLTGAAVVATAGLIKKALLW